MQKTQFAKGISWTDLFLNKNKTNLCFAKQRSRWSVAFAASFIIYMIMLVSNYCFVKPGSHLQHNNIDIMK